MLPLAFLSRRYIALLYFIAALSGYASSACIPRGPVAGQDGAPIPPPSRSPHSRDISVNRTENISPDRARTARSSTTVNAFNRPVTGRAYFLPTSTASSSPHSCDAKFFSFEQRSNRIESAPITTKATKTEVNSILIESERSSSNGKTNQRREFNSRI